MNPSPQSNACKHCPAWSKSVFRNLSERHLNELADEKIEVCGDRGRPFSVQGAPATDVYWIREGAAKVTLQSSGTIGQSIVRLAGDGDLLGYRCIFSETHFRATASALGATSTCRISKSFFLKLIREDAEFSLEILKRMGNAVSDSESHHDSFCKRSSRERIAEALIFLADKFGRQVDNGTCIAVYLSRLEFSEWVGVAKETLIRCLSDFASEGLIQLANDGIVVLKPLALNSIATPGGVPKYGRNDLTAP